MVFSEIVLYFCFEISQKILLMALKFFLVVILILIEVVELYSQERNDTTKFFFPEKQFDQFLLYKDSLKLYDNSDFFDHDFDYDYGISQYSQITPHKRVSPLKRIYLGSLKYIIPVTYISYGVISRSSESLQVVDYEVHEKIEKNIKRKFHIDDYLQFAPATAVFGLDIAGVKAKNNLRDRIFVMTTSHLIMGTTVSAMKAKINKLRPNGTGLESFPSGHTATVFTGAHVLFREYKDTSPWIGVAGYTTATVTGVLRMVNNRHWFSDVITGAGIGILSAELGYVMLPVFQKLFDGTKMQNNLIISPSVSSDNYGFEMVYIF